MKLSLITLAATLAVVVKAETCDLGKISPLLISSDVPTCTTDSGFSFTTLAPPMPEVLPKICASTACKSVLAAVKALGLGDCTLIGVRLETDVVMPIENACGGGSNSSSNSTMAGNMTTGNTMTPTATPMAISKSGSGSSAASPSSENTPAPSSTPTPTPTPTSGASSSVALATTAVIVAIAAAIF